MVTKIENRFTYNCTPDLLFRAISEAGEVKKWWTDECESINGENIFHWRTHNWRVAMRPTKAVPIVSVEWLCTDSNMQDTDAWKGSTLSFQMAANRDGTTTLDFVHNNYKNSPCLSECTAGWTFVLGKSLKGYLESGKGMPFENTP